MRKCGRQPLLLFLVLAAVPAAAETVDTAWVRRYDGPAHLSDRATALAVDIAGNVYVAGYSEGYGSLADWVTTKYSPNGDSIWTRRASFGGNDVPYGMAVDGQGNVYVTGFGNGRPTTVKYGPSGQVLWNLGLGSPGGATDLALDVDGNVLLCGNEYRSTADFLTMKLWPSGDTQWVRARDWAGDEDVATALTATPAGCVVTGQMATSSTHLDVATAAYDSAGGELWAARFDGPLHGMELAADVASGHGQDPIVVVAGRGDNGYLTPTDYLTIKYDSSGETLWTRRYDGPAGGTDEARAVGVDRLGSIVVTGHSSDPATSDDIATVKYDTAGRELWVRRYNGPRNNADAAYDLALDSLERIYVAGRSRQSAGSGYDCLCICYGSAGESLWAVSYDGPAHSTDEAHCVAVGPDGSVFIAGFSMAESTGSDIVTAKYVRSGAIAEPAATAVQRPGLTVGPNPFRRCMVVSIRTSDTRRARLRVHDVSGRAVRELTPDDAGRAVWDGRDGVGRRLPPGMYTIVLRTGTERFTTSVALIH